MKSRMFLQWCENFGFWHISFFPAVNCAQDYFCAFMTMEQLGRLINVVKPEEIIVKVAR